MDHFEPWASVFKLWMGPHINVAAHALNVRVPVLAPFVIFSGGRRAHKVAVPLACSWLRWHVGECEAHRLLYHSTLGLRVMKKEEEEEGCGGWLGSGLSFTPKLRNLYRKTNHSMTT